MKKMIKTFLCLIPVMTTSCAFLSPTQPKEDLTLKALSNSPEIENLSSKELQTLLSRTITMSGGIYTLSFYPLTETLVKARAHELALQRGLSKEEEQEVNDYYNQQWNQSRTCFQFDYNVLRFAPMADIKSWQAWLLLDLKQVGEGEIDEQEGQAQKFPLTWLEPYNESVKSFAVKVNEKLESWNNYAIGCTMQKLSLDKGMAIKVRAKITSWPYPQEDRLEWVAHNLIDEREDSAKMNDQDTQAEGAQDDQKAPMQRPSSYKRYRGW